MHAVKEPGVLLPPSFSRILNYREGADPENIPRIEQRSPNCKDFDGVFLGYAFLKRDVDCGAEYRFACAARDMLDGYFRRIDLTYGSDIIDSGSK